MPVQPLSLSTQSGLKILETIHENSVKLEDNHGVEGNYYYEETVKKWRESLIRQEVMTPEMMRFLMELAMRLFRPVKDQSELGAETLQAVLTCQWTESLLSLTTGNIHLAQIDF